MMSTLDAVAKSIWPEGLRAAGSGKVLLAAAGLVCLGLQASAAANPAAGSGQYGPLTLVVTGNTVTGIFSDPNGRGPPDSSGIPQYICSFMLKGQLEGTRARISTWAPGDTSSMRGELTFNGGKVSLTLLDFHAGCDKAGDDMTAKPREESLSEPAGNWIGVGMVAASRAVLQPTPAASARRTPYLGRFDPVAIVERKQGWVKVIYLEGKTVTGWLRQFELAPDNPPRE